MEIELIKKMIEEWRNEFYSIKEQLIINGGESNSLEYNLLATEALRLSMCINDATDLILSIVEKEINKSKEDEAERKTKASGLTSMHEVLADYDAVSFEMQR